MKENKILTRSRYLIGFLGKDIKEGVTQAINDVMTFEELAELCTMFDVSVDEIIDYYVKVLKEEVENALV